MCEMYTKFTIHNKDMIIFTTLYMQVASNGKCGYVVHIHAVVCTVPDGIKGFRIWTYA